MPCANAYKLMWALLQCRSLTFWNRIGGADPCHCLTELSELTCLRLCIPGRQEMPDVLTSLCNLKELTYYQRHFSIPLLLVSRAAELTKIEIEGHMVSPSRHVFEA